MVNRSSRVCQRPPPSRLSELSSGLALAIRPAAQDQVMVAISIGAATPFTGVGRRAEVGTLARLSERLGRREDLPAPGERTDTGGDVDALAAVVGAAAVRLGRVEPDPHRRGEAGADAVVAQRRWIEIAQSTPGRAASNAAKKPSPVELTISPPPAVTRRRSVSSCHRRSRSQASSPSASARFVEPTMSVNMKVLRVVTAPLRRSSTSRCSRSTASRSIRAPSGGTPPGPPPSSRSAPSSSSVTARRARARTTCTRATSYGEPTSRQPLTALRSSAIAAAGLALRQEHASQRAPGGPASSAGDG